MNVDSKAQFIVCNFSDNFLLMQKITGLVPECLPCNLPYGQYFLNHA